MQSLLRLVTASCRSQTIADSYYHVPWSRHLLACLRRVLAVDLLVGARAVLFHPHFVHFYSPDQLDWSLGAVRQWPPLPALLLLDAFPPDDRPSILELASQHNHPVWILRLDQPSQWASNDLRALRNGRAHMAALIPAHSLVLHGPGCWREAQWDSVSSHYVSQLWLMSPILHEQSPKAQSMQHLLGRWDFPRHDFCHCSEPSSPHLGRYRTHQQDALIFTGHGLFAGSDGSVNQQQEKMGAGYVIIRAGDLTPIVQCSASVGGPLFSGRAEAVALLSLLRRISEELDAPSMLVIFIDCLWLLQILFRWGRSNFWPGPKDVCHFDVILPLLRILREWPATSSLTLMKVKSHAGCYLNDMADEQAHIGCAADESPLFAGPQKYGTLLLQIRPSLRVMVSEERIPITLSADTVPNKSLLRQVVRANIFRAVKLRTTIFADTVVKRAEAATVARLISSCTDSEIRCWMQATTGTYPVMAYLRRIDRVKSALCPFCSSGQDETLTHFLSVCPRFHDARTAAHNQIRAQLSASLRKHLPADWRLLEETPMVATHLKMCSVPTVLVQQSGRATRTRHQQADSMSLHRWQPDLVVISYSRHKIAIVDVCRPSDIRLERLQTAFQQKLSTYAPLIAALNFYTQAGWDVQILPWVVGARGMICTDSLRNTLKFLDIPKNNWSLLIDDTVRSSISALAFMHRIRFAIFSPGSSSTPTSQHIDAALGAWRGAKRKRASGIGDLDTLMARWKRMVANVQWR